MQAFQHRHAGRRDMMKFLAAGAAAASATANYQGCINSGSTISVKLNSAATVRA